MSGYGNDPGFASWLSANGYTLPAGSPTAAVLRARGSAYIDGTYRQRFSGRPTGGFDQALAWPRTDAMVYGQNIPSDVVPEAVIRASYAAAWQDATAPGSLSVVGSGASQIKRVKAGPAEVEYQQPSDDFAASLVPLITMVEGLLAPFLSAPVAMPAILVV